MAEHAPGRELAQTPKTPEPSPPKEVSDNYLDRFLSELRRILEKEGNL